MKYRLFDQLTHDSASVTTRRVVCTAISGGVLGSLLTRFGLEEAAGACKKLKKRCRRTDECCGALVCGRKSKDHRCTSGLPRKNCCIPPGGRCRFEECECCGNYGCSNGKCKRM